ncbi:YcxB family protein [Paenibacillus faecalis]|uniref:YcxB family protein n=1 Tax=Paenibacillus faecalis TaxID=2079532 RepID=UPI000D10AFD1|nr:YcxB family protein [Paenibacillus faecalis]
MKVEIDLNQEDFWKFNKYVMFNLPKYKISMILSLLSIPVSCIIVSKLLGSGWAFAIVVGVIIGGLADVLFLYRIKRRTMSLVKKNDGILGKHIIEINEQGVFDSTDRSQSTCGWSGIHELRQDKENIYIFLNQLQATIVPKRSFTDQQEEAKFIQTVQQYANKSFIGG